MSTAGLTFPLPLPQILQPFPGSGPHISPDAVGPCPSKAAAGQGSSSPRPCPAQPLALSSHDFRRPASNRKWCRWTCPSTYNTIFHLVWFSLRRSVRTLQMKISGLQSCHCHHLFLKGAVSFVWFCPDRLGKHYNWIFQITLPNYIFPYVFHLKNDKEEEGKGKEGEIEEAIRICT